jgi:hypothetical protein
VPCTLHLFGGRDMNVGNPMNHVVNHRMMHPRQQETTFQVVDRGVEFDAATGCFATESTEELLGRHGPSWAKRPTRTGIPSVVRDSTTNSAAGRDVRSTALGNPCRRFERTSSRGSHSNQNPTWVNRAIWTASTGEFSSRQPELRSGNVRSTHGRAGHSLSVSCNPSMTKSDPGVPRADFFLGDPGWWSGCGMNRTRTAQYWFSDDSATSR